MKTTFYHHRVKIGLDGYLIFHLGTILGIKIVLYKIHRSLTENKILRYRMLVGVVKDAHGPGVRVTFEERVRVG